VCQFEDCVLYISLPNEELHNFYSSRNIIRLIKLKTSWAGHVARMEEMRNALKILVGKSKGNRPLGRPKHRWEDNIRMDVREIGREGLDWIHLPQDRDQWRAVVKTVINHRLP
jgi:hypothetical protein